MAENNAEDLSQANINTKLSASQQRKRNQANLIKNRSSFSSVDN